MSKFCNKCGTENKDEYIFCKRCGMPLPAAKEEENQAYGEYDGISVADMEIAVGTNQNKILGKFRNMRLANSKISWCWPVAILSYFFGLFGSAIWFFYRKMYKTAIICLAIGIALSVGKFFIIKEPITEFLDGIAAVTEKMQAQIDKEIDKGVDRQTVANMYEDFLKIYSDYTEKYNKTNAMRYNSLLSMAEQYLSTIGFGMFAMYLYRKHLIKKIKKIKQSNSDVGSYKNTLARSLGTSGGMAVFGVFAMLIASNITSLLAVISYFK